jgi:hypothetical protein
MSQPLVRVTRYPRRSGVAAVCALAFSLSTQADVAWTRQDAGRLREKVDLISRNASASAPVALRTRVTENEVNAYLAFDAGDQLPAGVVEPRVWMLGGRKVAARAIVDLDAVRREHQSTGWFDPMRLLSGRLAVSATGSLIASDGLVRFEFESADVARVPIPKTLLQELLTFYTRTSDNPKGLSLDDEYRLPAKIRGIELARSEAIVVQ